MLQEKKYYPQLDAIRGLSFLAVFFFHAYKPKFGSDSFSKLISFFYEHLTLSIDVFFILSAFLLTLLGLREFDERGSFSFKNYFVRRALRIWPLYYLLMFLTYVIITIIAKYAGQEITLPPAQWYLFFAANFYNIGHVFFIKVLWTLSVEEQFYLIWGICLFYFQKNIKIVLALLAAVSIAFNIWGAFNGRSIYFHTLTYLVDMMAGAFAAYCVNKNNKVAITISKMNGYKSILFYLFLPVFFTICYFIDKSFLGIANNIFAFIMRFVFVVYCCFLIIDQMVNTNNTVDLSKGTFLVYTGKISYGLYCFHGFVITFSSTIFIKLKINAPPFLLAFIMLFITFFIASLSYKFLEKPFLNLKGKLF